MKNILYTRLMRPKCSSVTLKRDNIKKLINEIENNKVALVKGGPAVGKSTIISNFVKDKKHVWLSIDEDLDDLNYFWCHIIYGLKDYIKSAEMYMDILDQITDINEIFNIISSIINEIIGQNLIIVLDDFYFLKDEFLLKTVEFFIKNASSDIHFILISREDINIYLGDIMIDGAVYLNDEDFKLTLPETSEYIKSSFKEDIDDNDIEEIYNSTEGWIGAISLLMNLQKGRNFALPKKNKIFISYINNEVMKELSKDDYMLLVKTSLMNYVDEELCILAAGNNGFSMFKKMAAKNSLIIVIDEENEVYRYHNVLREFLINEFQDLDIEEKNNYLKKLINYLIDKCNYDDALKIAVENKMYNRGIEIVKSYVDKISSSRMFYKFPKKYYRESIDLTLITAFKSIINLKFNDFIEIADSLDDLLDKSPWNVINIIKNIFTDNYVNVDFDNIKMNIEGDFNPFTEIVYYSIISFAVRMKGEYSKSLYIMDKIIMANKKYKNVFIDIFSLYHKAALLEDMGYLKESEKLYLECGRIIEKFNGPLSTKMIYYIALPGVYIKSMELSKAESVLNKAYENLRYIKDTSSFSDMKRDIQYNDAEIKSLSGDYESCSKILEDLLKGVNNDEKAIVYAALRIRLLISSSILKEEDFKNFINMYESINSIRFDYVKKIDTTYAICLYKTGDTEKSINILDNIIFEMRKEKIYYSLCCALVVKSIILDSTNCSSDKVIDCLKESLFYCRKENILKIFVIYRKSFKNLFDKYKNELDKQEDLKDFTDKICDFLDMNKVSFPFDLSDREAEILKELSKGLTNKEISQKLYISVATVKTHLINIYSKLNVRNRTEAVNKYKSFIK